MFTKHTKVGYIVVLVYIDDLLITGSHLSLIQQLQQQLHTILHMKNLGSLRYFLGLEVARSEKGIFICQRKYVLDLLRDIGMLAAKPVYLPMDSNAKLVSEGPLLSEPKSYRRLIGELIDLTVTRLDITYSVQVLSQFMKSTTLDHMHAAMCVLRYLKRAPGQGILLSASSISVLTTYCDNDWGSCLGSRKSTTGFLHSVG